MKTAAVGLAGYIVFFIAWVWYFLRPGFDKAIGMAALKAALWGNPVFWTLGITAAFGSASLYLLARR